MYKVIVIAGTPGVGKSTISRLLSDKLGFKHVDLSMLALEKKHVSFYDDERESYVIDENALVNEVLELIKHDESLIIDTHYPEILPPDIVDIVVVLRLHPRILEERLRKKGWSWRKTRENVLAEILSVVTTNAIHRFGYEKVYEVDTTGRSVEEVLEIVIDILENREKYSSGLRIDWLTRLSLDEISRYERDEGERIRTS